MIKTLQDYITDNRTRTEKERNALADHFAQLSPVSNSFFHRECACMESRGCSTTEPPSFTSLSHVTLQSGQREHCVFRKLLVLKVCCALKKKHCSAPTAHFVQLNPVKTRCFFVNARAGSREVAPEPSLRVSFTALLYVTLQSGQREHCAFSKIGVSRKGVAH